MAGWDFTFGCVCLATPLPAAASGLSLLKLALNKLALADKLASDLWVVGFKTYVMDTNPFPL